MSHQNQASAVQNLIGSLDNLINPDPLWRHQHQYWGRYDNQYYKVFTRSQWYNVLRWCQERSWTQHHGRNWTRYQSGWLPQYGHCWCQTRVQHQNRGLWLHRYWQSECQCQTWYWRMSRVLAILINWSFKHWYHKLLLHWRWRDRCIQYKTILSWTQESLEQRDKANLLLPYKLAGLLVPKKTTMKQHPLVLVSMIILRIVLESIVWYQSPPEEVPGSHGLIAHLYPGYWISINDVLTPFTNKNSSSAVSEQSVLCVLFLRRLWRRPTPLWKWKWVHGTVWDN